MGTECFSGEILQTLCFVGNGIGYLAMLGTFWAQFRVNILKLRSLGEEETASKVKRLMVVACFPFTLHNVLWFLGQGFIAALLLGCAVICLFFVYGWSVLAMFRVAKSAQAELVDGRVGDRSKGKV